MGDQRRTTMLAAYGILVGFLLVLAFLGIHKVDEGHVGIYYHGGALVDTFSEPGYHLQMPFYTTTESIQITVQTDAVTNIPCGTSGGVMTTFSKVEVVNRLRKEFVVGTVRNYTSDYDKIWIFDRVHHEINQFCSSNTLQSIYIDKFDTLDEAIIQALSVAINEWAPGIEIISVRITKPQIPASIAQNYQLMEQERTKLKIAVEDQKVVERQAQTDRQKAKIEAEKVAAVAVISMQQQVAEKEGRRDIEVINTKMELARAKANADAKFYAASKEAEGNSVKLTPRFLHLEKLKASTRNATLFFGDAIPSTLVSSFLKGA